MPSHMHMITEHYQILCDSRSLVCLLHMMIEPQRIIQKIYLKGVGYRKYILPKNKVFRLYMWRIFARV